MPWWSAVNKWDAVDDYRASESSRTSSARLNFLGFARMHYISARQGEGVGGVLTSVEQGLGCGHGQAAHASPNPRALIAAVAKQTPPRHGMFRPKMRYAHQGGQNPPLIVIHGNALEHIPDSYRRYLERAFIDRLPSCTAPPLRIQFKTFRKSVAGYPKNPQPQESELPR